MKFELKNRTKALWLTLLAVVLCGAKSFAADDVKLTVNAPFAVAMGTQFEVSFTVNHKDARDFRAPSFDNFIVDFGPTRSSQSYTSVVNGNMTQVNNLTYTYILRPTKEGSFTLDKASISVKGKTFTSDKQTIKVVPEDKTPNRSGANSGNVKKGKQVDKLDVFIVAQLSKSNVYEQEATVLTHKLYVSSISLSGIRLIKSPDFKGVHAQDLINTNNVRWELEHYKGRNYRTAILKQQVLLPQQSGKIKIDPITYEVEVEQPMEFDDPFDAFFNSARSSSFRQNISSPALTLNVRPLPSNKPMDFSNGVGKFSLTSSVSSNQVKANEAVTIKLVISGTGNMKLMSTPVVEFPADFEVYDPKVEDHLRITSEGETGNRVIEYLVIPRHDGNFKIDPIKFSYFDLRSQNFKTLSTDAITLKVEKSASGSTNSNPTAVSNFTNKEDLKILNEDIRFIKLNPAHIKENTDFIQGTTGYRMFFLISSIIFIVFIAFNAKQAKLNSNVALVRNKKANKMAKNRMKAAYKLMQAGNKEEFYDEVLRALWGYISDKLTIPVSKLSKDNIDQELTNKEVEESLRKDFINVLNDCEFAKFAPGDDSLSMDKILARATQLIGNLEGVIKNK